MTSESKQKAIDYLKGWGAFGVSAISVMVLMYSFIGAPTPSQLQDKLQAQREQIVVLVERTRALNAIQAKVNRLELNERVQITRINNLSEKFERIDRKLGTVQDTLGQLSKQIATLISQVQRRQNRNP